MTTNEQIIAEFEQMLQALIGKQCWSAQLSGVGSLFNLQLGDQIERRQPLTYPDFRLTPEERRYQGEYVLYVEDCPWRIESREVVLTTWLDASSPGGPLATSLQQLVDSVVLSVELCRPGLDLILRFSNDLTLRVFPDQINADEGDNYAVALPERIFVVAAHSTLYIDQS